MSSSSAITSASASLAGAAQQQAAMRVQGRHQQMGAGHGSHSGSDSESNF